MPNTTATSVGEAWQALERPGGVGVDEPFAAASADYAVSRALRLARALERLVLLRTRDPLRSDPALVEALAALGAGEPDPARTAVWRRDALAGVGTHRPGRDSLPAPLPPLLAALLAAQAWSERGDDAAQALLWRGRATGARGPAAGRAAAVLGGLPRLRPRRRTRGGLAGRAGSLPGAGSGRDRGGAAGRAAASRARPLSPACASWTGWRGRPNGGRRQRGASTGARACRTPSTPPCARRH